MAINEIRITTIEQINDLIWKQEYESDKDRHRANYLFRGLPNSEYHLVTSLHRNCMQKSALVEKPLLRNFTKYASLEYEALSDNTWMQMVIGQHHGLPTRLLDWTYSVLVALHFATSCDDLTKLDKNDAVIWAIDIEEMNGKLPRIFRKTLGDERAYLMTIDMLGEVFTGTGYDAIERYDDNVDASAMVILEPPSVDQRIISQYSYFSVIPKGMENDMDDLGIERFLDTTNNTYKYIIDKDLKWRIRDMLDQMNINERTIYPGLDGLTQWLKRHYYVKRNDDKDKRIDV